MNKQKTRVKTTWDIRTYDVWGNSEDGYDVNNVFAAGEVTIACKIETNNVGTPGEFQSAYPSDYQIKKIFGVSCAIDTDGDDTTIYVSRARDRFPIGELHCTSHSSLSPIRP